MTHVWRFSTRARVKHLFLEDNFTLAICGTTRPYTWREWKMGKERLAELRPCKRCVKTKELIDEIEADRVKNLEKDTMEVLEGKSNKTWIPGENK